jgi:hypothetical protein
MLHLTIDSVTAKDTKFTKENEGKSRRQRCRRQKAESREQEAGAETGKLWKSWD